MDIYEKFKAIERRFKELDEDIRREHGKPFFDTAHGIWGASSMLDAFDVFLRMRLGERRGFVDLGSGDGRIVLIAALFTQSRGIEGDETLHKLALRIRDELLPIIPELSRCSFTHGDYTKEDLSAHDTLFTFCDHPWSAEFEERLQREVKGVLLSYNKIFLPQRLKKGRTYWVQQLPVVTYWLGMPEEELFTRE